jgi:hypothetical protein
VADLLGAHSLEQILVRLGRRVAPEVHALEEVLHHGAHLAELATETLLQSVGRCGIRLVDGDLVDELLGVQVHVTPRTCEKWLPLLNHE